MELETERLILRSFREEDLDLMAPLMADAKFMQYSLGVYDRDQTAAFVDKVISWERAGKPSLLAVELKPERPLLGYCGFFHHPTEFPGEVEIGYRLHPAYRNRGLITEAAHAVRDYAFRKLKLARVISLIHPANIPSRRIAEKMGMTFEKEITFRGFPTRVFAITQGQWLAKRGAG
jgi:RimJ/RimL family protein N-acetyltransferase